MVLRAVYQCSSRLPTPGPGRLALGFFGIALVVSTGLPTGCPMAHAHGASLESVAALVRAHDNEAALKALDAIDPNLRNDPRVRYARGRILERLGRYVQAADALSFSTVGLPPPVIEDVAKRRAFLLAKGGECDRARPLLAGLAAKEKNPSSIGARLAECALATSDFGGAVQAFKQVLRTSTFSGSFRLRLQYAEALEKSGDVTGARAQLRALLVAHPAHPAIGEVGARLAATGKPVVLTSAEHAARAKRLMAARRYEEAIGALDAAGRPSDRKELVEWLHLRGTALYRSRQRYADAADVLREAARMGGKTAESDEFHAARALSRADKDDEAIAAYRAFVKRKSRSEYAPYAEFLAAWLELRHGRASGAANMEAFLRGARSRRVARLRREALWYLAFRAFEQSEYPKAAELFLRYSKERGGGMVRGRGQYWCGRARLLSNERTSAVSAFKSAIAADPLHWYALLSRERLEELGEPVPRPFSRESASTITATPASLSEPSLPKEAQFYLFGGFDREAAASLAPNEKRIMAAAPRGRGLEALARAYERVGDHGRPFALVMSKYGRALFAPPTASTAWVWRVAYARPYHSYTDEQSRAQQLPMDYLYALMRQESRFRAEVVSHADAVGLLQMLPSTADRVASSLGLHSSRERLFDPLWNIRVGAFYNGTLYRDFGKQMPLAVAAYNAGPHKVRSWLKSRAPVELDRFVERIPIDETRNYVRAVMTNFARYRYLASPGPWPIRLPRLIDPSTMRLAAEY